MFKRRKLYLLIFYLIFLTQCVRPAADDPFVPPARTQVPTPVFTPTVSSWLVPTHNPSLPYITPTPNPAVTLPALRQDTVNYTVKPGDTLAGIGRRYTLPVSVIVKENKIKNPDLLEVGQQLVLPPPKPEAPGPADKLLPDSELVRSPSAMNFNIFEFVRQTNGFLATYSEEVNEIEMTGAQVVDRVSIEYSIHPRVLLAWLEHEGNWISNKNPDEAQIKYPAGLKNPYYEGLYKQMAWAANTMSLGYYLWDLNAVSAWILADDSLIPPDPTINAGTAAIQQIAAQLYDQETWRKTVANTGFIQTYRKYFGETFDYTIEPLISAPLESPSMQLPFEPGDVWSFTGGPHNAWGSGSPWAAIDFAPPGDALGCVQSDVWVTAVADGFITYSNFGLVIQDLGDDQRDETGWAVIYLHIETRDRVPAGTLVNAGDRIGHPSCEGGVSSGTHVHLARRYNGVWISADQEYPFDLDGWVSEGTGIMYNGYLVKDGNSVEAWDRRVPENQIQR